jgi:hypothetical protein
VEDHHGEGRHGCKVRQGERERKKERGGGVGERLENRYIDSCFVCYSFLSHDPLINDKPTPEGLIRKCIIYMYIVPPVAIEPLLEGTNEIKKNS